MCGFHKIRGTFLGVPVIRIVHIWVYIGVSLIWQTTIYDHLGFRVPLCRIKRKRIEHGEIVPSSTLKKTFTWPHLTPISRLFVGPF